MFKSFNRLLLPYENVFFVLLMLIISTIHFVFFPLLTHIMYSRYNINITEIVQNQLILVTIIHLVSQYFGCIINEFYI